MKQTTVIVSCLLSVLLLTASAPMFNSKSANAWNGASEWGHLAPNYDPDEYNWTSIVSYCIETDFNAYGWTNYNEFWNETTQNNVMNYLIACHQPINDIDFSAIWWTGDFNFFIDAYATHYGCRGENDNIWDAAVYTGSTLGAPSNQFFVFMWTCTNGGIQWNNTSGGQDEIEGLVGWNNNLTDQEDKPDWVPTNTNTEYGYFDSLSRCVGMPLAWTGTADLSLDGFNDPDSSDYCYIGFQNHSPWLHNAPLGWGSTPMGYFPYYFYRYAMGLDSGGIHEPIWLCLEYASMIHFTSDFEDTPLYNGWWEWLVAENMTDAWWFNQMTVFGNSDIALP
ncbi:MAG: hypothetical protein NWF05_03130 [Candidatus Bathyarchaeota archaeon]|nr:hypothetical protein [Candidatus Bathyarchaeota archaeon]